MQRIRREKGFTLIELIMVVVIISILAVVIVPQFASQSGKAAKAATKANIEILRTAIEAFAAENEGTYPTDLTTDLVSSGGNVKYLRKIPQEKWTPSNALVTDPTPADFVTAADVSSSGTGGWMFNTTNGDIKLNLTGADFEGENHIDY